MRETLAAYGVLDVVLLVVSAVVGALSIVALSERHRFASVVATAGDTRARPFPSRSRALLTAPGTVVAEGAAARAAALRASLRASVLVLPVLARASQRPGWCQLHDAADSWLWHESWLRSQQPAPRTLPVDGLVIGTDLVVPQGRVALVRVPDAAPLSVVPAAEGVILSRPAARRLRDLVGRIARDARVVAVEARRRPQSGVLLTHGLVGFPVAVAAPVAAFALSSPPAVAWAALLPLAAGGVSTVLRWSALAHLDRSTTVHLPVWSGLLLALTGPLHAALTCVGSWASFAVHPPVDIGDTASSARLAA